MNPSGKKKVRVKKTVCAVTATAMLCLAQPVWGDNSVPGSGVAVSETVTAVDSSGQAGSESVTDNEIPKGAKISSKQAEDIIKKAFPELKNVKVSNVQFLENDGMRSSALAWDLQMVLTKGNSSSGFNAQVNAVTGELLNIYIPNSLVNHGSDKPVLTREAAKEKALKWIGSHVSDVKASELKENEAYLGMQAALFSPPRFEFYFQTSVNGIESDVNSISITLDGQGNTINYSRNQINEEFPSSTPKLNEASIRKLFEDQFQVSLAYVPDHLYNNAKGNYFLGYIPNDQSGNSLDANTGKFISFSGEESGLTSVENGAIPASKEIFKPITAPFAGGEAAARWVESQIKLPSGLKTESKRLGTRWNNSEVKTWNISWGENKLSAMGGGEMVSAEVDAKTGQIYSYNRYRFDRTGAPEVKSPISQQAAQDLAFETVSKLVPNAAEEWKLTSVDKLGKDTKTINYQFSFQRYVGDIRIMGDSLNLTMEGDGQIQGFSVNSDAVLSKLPTDVKPAISAEQARAKYLEEIDLKLKYGYYGGYSMTGNEIMKPFIKLIYYPTHKKAAFGGITVPLDAKSGEWRDIMPEMSRKDIPAVTDTAGHYAEASLKELVKYRVLVPDKDGKVYPDRQITLGEWYQLVAASVSPSYEQVYGRSTMDPYAGLQPDHPYYQAIQVLIGQNWIPYDPDSPLQLDRKLTRDELASSLTRILNYEKLSKAFILPTDVQGISDADAVTNKGAALIALKLGLLPAVDGKFLPEREVTRAEAAEVLVRMAKLAGRSDSFLSSFYW
ncbi:S-layer protein [Paenibacillus lautus]|uniref:YcdB/YcdC domain-containing protein n=1 Tax=Paenibacillus lautus TaxID=1401 RepID=UPI002DB9664F|nr:YcdB/YcdC domain-containing protein [Paenibacillus lautus]MEC0206099.1 S-layer protein [Paenibacillus lautus]